MPPVETVQSPVPVETPPEELSWWENAIRNSRLLRLLRGSGVSIDPVVDKAQSLVETPSSPTVKGVLPVPVLPLPGVPQEAEKQSNYSNPAAYNVPGGGMTVANAPGPALASTDGQMGAIAPMNPGAPSAPGPMPGQGMTRTGSFKGANASPMKQDAPQNMMQGANAMNTKVQGKAPAELPVANNAKTDSSLSVPGTKNASVVRKVMSFFSEGAQNSKALKNVSRELRGIDSHLVDLAGQTARADQRGVDAFRKTLLSATGGAIATPKDLKAQKQVLQDMFEDATEKHRIFSRHAPEKGPSINHVLADPMAAQKTDAYVRDLFNPMGSQFADQADDLRTQLHGLQRAEQRAVRASLPHVRESNRLGQETKDLISKKKVLKHQIKELQPSVKKYQDAIDLGIGAAGIGVTAGGLGYLHKEGSEETPFDRVMRTKFANEFSTVVRDLTTPFVGPAGNENLENILAATGGMGLGAVLAQNVGKQSLINQSRESIKPMRRMMRDVQGFEGLGFPFRKARSVAAERLLAEADTLGLDGKKLLSSIRRGADLGDISSDLMRHSMRSAKKSRRLPGALLGGLAGLTGLGLMRDMAPTKQMNRELLRAQIDQMRGPQGVMEPSQYMYEVATDGSGRYM